jgi:hypothetical protein
VKRDNVCWGKLGGTFFALTSTNMRHKSFSKSCRLSVLLAIVSVLSCLLSGCGGLVSYVDENGQRRTRRVNGYWELFKVSVDHDVRLELAGERPPGQRTSWQEWWDSRLLAVRQLNDNPERKIDYIHTRRREAGLPPLE